MDEHGLDPAGCPTLNGVLVKPGDEEAEERRELEAKYDAATSAAWVEFHRATADHAAFRDTKLRAARENYHQDLDRHSEKYFPAETIARWKRTSEAAIKTDLGYHNSILAPDGTDTDFDRRREDDLKHGRINGTYDPTESRFG